MNATKIMKLLDNLKQSRTFRIFNAIVSSAMLGLLLAFVFFGYDVYKENRQEHTINQNFEATVDQLEKIKQSLSTRFLGRFPTYLTEINRIMQTIQPQDTVIIFEDVLYYGFKSRPNEFRRLNSILLSHARHGGQITIAYYNPNPPFRNTAPWQSVFHRMIVEECIDSEWHGRINIERQKRWSELPINERSTESKLFLDSVITEYYFQQTIQGEKAQINNHIKSYLTKELVTPDDEVDVIVNDLCQKIDNIKHQYLGKKNADNIRFSDFERMYTDISLEIAECYKYHGIELIPMNEYLTMSCWLLKPSDRKRPMEAILAFPSKYSTYEIGFYSQDEEFAAYISTMLSGVKNSFNQHRYNNDTKDK